MPGGIRVRPAYRVRVGSSRAAGTPGSSLLGRPRKFDTSGALMFFDTPQIMRFDT